MTQLIGDIRVCCIYFLPLCDDVSGRMITFFVLKSSETILSWLIYYKIAYFLGDICLKGQKYNSVARHSAHNKSPSQPTIANSEQKYFSLGCKYD